MQYRALTMAALLLACAAPVHAYDITDEISIRGVLAGAAQCQSVSGAPGVDDECKGAIPFQPELSVKPTAADEFFAKLGFAAGNDLNGVSPFVLAPWAADLEDDVKNINGRNRDYLLTAWYERTFAFADGRSLVATLGIIDATDYVDENAYANDEYTQLMNETFVNGPHAFLPSYDAGGALEWNAGPLSTRGVYMNVGENDDGNSYNFLAAQIGYRVKTSLGEGTYRVLADTTSKEFLDPGGSSLESLTGVGVSIDQELGKTLGGFLPFGWQNDDAAIDYEAIYTGGMNIAGSAWGRGDDNVGVGIGYLEGGNIDISNSKVAEIYHRWAASEHLGVTADVQYMGDDYKAGGDIDGAVLGLRLAAEF